MANNDETLQSIANNENIAVGNVGLVETESMSYIETAAATGASYECVLQMALPLDQQQGAAAAAVVGVLQLQPSTCIMIPTTGLAACSQIGVTDDGGKEEEEDSLDISELVSSILSPEAVISPASDTSLPLWAQYMNDYSAHSETHRGWVATERRLNSLIALYREHTGILFCTRQSERPNTCTDTQPQSNRNRLMWSSAYVPFDGIPFINYGSRAVIMECQFGPRKCKRLVTNTPSCPAKICIKKVKKFPQHAIALSKPNYSFRDKKYKMAEVFSVLKNLGVENDAESQPGEMRYYVHLPGQHAHRNHPS